VLFRPDGSAATYAKQRLFGGEASNHLPGHQAVAARLDRWDVGLNICYDSCFAGTISATVRQMRYGRPALLALPSLDPDSSGNFRSAAQAEYPPFGAEKKNISIAKSECCADSIGVDTHGRIWGRLGQGRGVFGVLFPATKPRVAPYNIALICTA